MTYRDAWVAVVLAHGGISDAVRVALLALAWDMTPDGWVEASRPYLAGRLDRSERRSDDRLNAGIAAGLLRRAVRGGNGRERAFQAIVPGASSETPGCPATGEVVGRPAAHYSGVVRRSAAHYSEGSETPGCPATRGSSETPGRPATSGPLYKDRARAHSEDLPPKPGSTISHRTTTENRTTDDPALEEDRKSVCQSGEAAPTAGRTGRHPRDAQAVDWLTQNLDLTPTHAAAAWDAVQRAAAATIVRPARYLARAHDDGGLDAFIDATRGTGRPQRHAPHEQRLAEALAVDTCHHGGLPGRCPMCRHSAHTGA